MIKVNIRTFFLSFVLFFTLFFWSNSLYIYAKAYLANFLIEHAWQKTLANKQYQKPWEWADTWPVGKIEFSKQKAAFNVLAGANGNALAFGPGLLNIKGDSSIAQAKIIAGHRDTHFSLLKETNIGDQINFQNETGKWTTYRVTDMQVMDIRNGEWRYNENTPELHLITCYPFDSIVPGGPLRYVVTAEKIENQPVYF